MKKKTPAPTPAPPAVAQIPVEQLAQLCNLSKRRLYQLAEENKIPTPANGMFPMLITITQLFGWYQRDGEQLAAERLKIATEQSRRLRYRNDETEGLSMAVTDAVRQAGEAEAYYFAELSRAERELPTMLGGLSPDQVAEVLRKFLSDLRQKSRDKFAVKPENKTP